MRSYLDRWARQLVKRGIRSGLIEGSNIWLSIGAVAWLVRFLARRQEPVVSVERLRLGESVVVSHVPAPPRSRRAKKKAARLAADTERREARLKAKRESSRRHRREASRDSSAQTAVAGKLARKPRSARHRHGRAPESAPARPEGDGEAPA
ncbi:MAG: hypothetical protein ABSG36_17170 [Acidimicrobiales bacterium]